MFFGRIHQRTLKEKNTKHIDIKDKMISEGSCDTKDWTLVILQKIIFALQE